MRTVAERRSCGSIVRVTSPSSIKWLTTPVKLPFETIRDSDSSDILRPAAHRSRAASTSKRGSVIWKSASNRAQQLFSMIVEQLSRRTVYFKLTVPPSLSAKGKFRDLGMNCVSLPVKEIRLFLKDMALRRNSTIVFGLRRSKFIRSIKEPPQSGAGRDLDAALIGGWIAKRTYWQPAGQRGGQDAGF